MPGPAIDMCMGNPGYHSTSRHSANRFPMGSLVWSTLHLSIYPGKKGLVQHFRDTVHNNHILQHHPHPTYIGCYMCVLGLPSQYCKNIILNLCTYNTFVSGTISRCTIIHTYTMSNVRFLCGLSVTCSVPNVSRSYKI